jgi:hypothetical protein
MSAREFVYETLKNYPALQTFVADRVYQGESLTHSTQVKPFVVYRMGNDTSELLAEVDAFPHRQFFQVYAHDEPADYYKLDQICDAVKGAFRARNGSGVDNIYTVVYLETSRDLDDPVLNTVLRYVRFQLVMG